MQSVLAIMVLTWRAALRFRLFVVIAGLLILAVVALPLVVKDDGTVRGFTQILLTYTLTVITALLGLSTLWLSCGTLARDIEESQMQMVVVKPVSRSQVWLGKWLGIVTLNAALLALTGGCVFGLLQWRAAHLPEDQRQKLRNEVLVSRGSARPESPMAEIEAAANQILQERLSATPELEANQADRAEVRRQIVEGLKADLQIVPSGSAKLWKVNLGSAANRLQDVPLHLRIKFNAANGGVGGNYTGLIQAGVPDAPPWRSAPLSLAPDTFHEIELPSNIVGDDGELAILFFNVNDSALLFPIEDGLEVLYREGGFLVNYVRALLIILCWMALLASLGLATSSFLSFPVASLVSVSLLILAFSSGTMALVVEEGTVMKLDDTTNIVGGEIVDAVTVPVFKALLGLIRLAKDYTPIDAISTGRSIPWGVVVGAFLKIVVVLGGCFAVGGMYLLGRREMAATQVG